MKVYIVFAQDPFQGDQLVDVYLDKAKADAEAATLRGSFGNQEYEQDVKVGYVVEKEVIE